MDAVTLALSGRLDATTAPALESELNASLGGVRELILDMAGHAHPLMGALYRLGGAPPFVTVQPGSPSPRSSRSRAAFRSTPPA